MKKLLAIAMIAGSLITSVFAQEKVRIDNVSLVLPVRMETDSGVKGIGLDYHGFTFKNSMFGFCAGASFWVPMTLFESNSGFYSFFVDASFGAAFKLLDTDMFQLILSPGVTVSMYDWFDTGFQFDFGVFGDACASFKLFDDFFITAGVQLNYYVFSWATIPGWGSASSNKTFFSFAPRIGVTFFE